MSIEPLYLKSEVPAACSGEWVVEKFEVPEPREPDNRPHWFRSPGGTYTRLRHGDETFMTDLREEWWTQRVAIREAMVRGGHVLITGLGLGMIVESIFDHPESKAEQITVVELSADVIRLVEPYLVAKYGDRLRVVEASAFEWTPAAAEPFSVTWHDIWPNPHDAAKLPEIEQLERRYAGWTDWQASWITHYLEEERRVAS